MDKFDDLIKNAKKLYEPRKDFVDTSMEKINNQHSKRHFRIKLWAPVLAGGLAVIALLFIVLPLGNNNSPSKEKLSSKTSSVPTQAVASSNTNGSVAAGTDNASLTSDLNSINGSIGQENSDQGKANSALNDQSQEITVPTN
jgi:hypothetical protein